MKKVLILLLIVFLFSIFSIIIFVQGQDIKNCEQSYELTYDFFNTTISNNIYNESTVRENQTSFIEIRTISTGEVGNNLTGWWYGLNLMDWLNNYTDELIKWGYSSCDQFTEHNIWNETTNYAGKKPSKYWEIYVVQDGSKLHGESKDMVLDGTINENSVVFRGIWKTAKRIDNPPCFFIYSNETEDFKGTASLKGDFYIIQGTLIGHKEYHKECHIKEPDYCEDYYKRMNKTWAGNFNVTVNPLKVKFLDAEDLDREVIGAAADNSSKVVIQIENLPPEINNPNQVTITFPENLGELLDDAEIKDNTFTQTWKAPADFGGGNPDMARKKIEFQIKLNEEEIEVPDFYLYKPPLLLLHGIWSNAGTWKLAGDYLIKNYFNGNELLINLVSYPNDIHFSENVRGIGIFTRWSIERARQQGWDEQIVVKKVDIVSHSMGGILANLYVNSPNYENDVNRIITFGTPHSGSEYANFALHFLYGEMSEENRTKLFNSLIYRLFKWKAGSITKGAVEDLQVGSPAINNYRQTLGKTKIPVFAITVKHGSPYPSLLIDIIYGISPLGIYWWDFYINKSHTHFEGVDTGLYDPLKIEKGLFGSKYSSDFIVSLRSQEGGSSAIRSVVSLDHISETINPYVHEMILNILNAPISSYDQDGFLPSADYPIPSVGVYNILETSEISEASTDIKISSTKNKNLTIISPINGSIFEPGSNITVKINYTGLPNNIYFLTQDLSIGMINTTPYQFSFIVNETYLGPMLIIAWVYNEDGSIEEKAIEVNIKTNDTPKIIRVLPYSPLYLNANDEIILYVEGVYTNENISRDITSHVVGTSYISSNTSVVTVSENGIITTISVGNAIINIINGITAELEIYVLKTCEEPVDGMVIRKKMEFCPGTYYLPSGISIDIDNVVIDCNGAKIIGSNSGEGIKIFNRRGLTIKNCTIQNFIRAISLNSSSNNILIFNKLNLNEYGIYLFKSDKNIISYNDISLNKFHGLFVENSSYINVFSNIFTANGKSTNLGYGIYLRYGLGALISNNIISNNSANNYAYGIKLRQFSNLSIFNNTISNNKDYGICFEFSDTAVIKDNMLLGNLGSIYINSSNYNLIYHNNIINNAQQAYDNGVNSWDNGEEGNYWSDYDEELEGCVDSNEDKICDSPYIIDFDSQDNYPFVKKNGWLTRLPGDVNNDCKVDIFDLAKVGLCYGCSSAQTCWTNCKQADVREDNKIDIFDLATVGLNYGKTC